MEMVHVFCKVLPLLSFVLTSETRELPRALVKETKDSVAKDDTPNRLTTIQSAVHPLQVLFSRLYTPYTGFSDADPHYTPRMNKKIFSSTTTSTLIQQKTTEMLTSKIHRVESNKKAFIIQQDDEVGTAGNDEKCVMNVTHDSISRFRHQVEKEQRNYVYFNLIPGSNISINGTRKVVGKTTWVWTFYGKEGALEFLSLPPEFKIWSAGLLYTYAYGPLNIKLKYEAGNCQNVVVGRNESDLAISEALSELTKTLMNMIYPEFKYKYGPSFWCYTQRTFINPEGLYILCKHIVCPLSAVEHRCCNYVFNPKTSQRSVICENKTHGYDTLWWNIPIVIATVLFMYCPLVIMFLAAKCSSISNNLTSKRENQFRNLNGDDAQEVVYLNETYPITLLGTLWSPLNNLICKNTNQFSRVARLFVPLSSLTFIAIQIVLDYNFLYDMVLTSIDKGVPMGFRSALAGYHMSSINFMPFLGGPYVAVPAYLCLTCIFLTVPKSLSLLLQSGLQRNSAECSPISPITLDLQTIETLGFVKIVRKQGYKKIYCAYIAQFYTLLNGKFWKFAVSLQCNRLKSLRKCYPCWILLPFYIVICLVELVICLIVYGFPIFSFGCTITRAYCGATMGCTSQERPSCILRGLKCLLNMFLLFCVMFFLFMFCTIFLDACLFITRVCMFTYTGLIVYPKNSYGVLIFAFTVFYYITVCAKTFAERYRNLLKISIRACDKVQRANDQPRLVVKGNDFQGINKPLFDYIIEVHCPKRIQAFISLLKLVTIVIILSISLNLLIKTDRFKELHTLMHVGTALFTCALPSICIKACQGPDDRIKKRQFKKRIFNTISIYAGYMQTMDSTDSGESD